MLPGGFQILIQSSQECTLISTDFARFRIRLMVNWCDKIWSPHKKQTLRRKSRQGAPIIPWLSWSQDIVGEQPAPQSLIPTAKNPREQEPGWAPVTLPHMWASMTPHRALPGKPQPVDQGTPVTMSPQHERILITPQTRRSLPSRRWDLVRGEEGGHLDCTEFTTCFRDKPSVGKGRDQAGLGKNKWEIEC